MALCLLFTDKVVEKRGEKEIGKQKLRKEDRKLEEKRDRHV
jgi:hypothetical protein